MIRLIKPYISYEEVEDGLKGIFSSGILTKGAFSKEFPLDMACYVGARHAFLTTSATTALWLCLKAAGIGPGDEVAVSDFSFPASVNVIEDLGAKPVFIDVSRETFNMLPGELEKAVTPAMKACMFVDALGNPSGLKEVASLCRRKGIVLIEDAACAIGSRIGEEKVGSIADLTCFSLHPRKLITCGEGGVITTNGDEYAEWLRVKLNHGADPDTGRYVDYGYNFRMPEIACMMGCSQLKKIDDIVKGRREQAARYRELLEPAGFIAQRSDPDVYHNMQSVVFRVPEGMDRNGLIAYLRDDGVESTIGTYCLSECDYYRGKYDCVQPNASYLFHNAITLPCYEDVPVQIVADRCLAYAAQTK